MIKLRPIKMNCNWEDEVDEYTGNSDLDDKWDKDFGDDSEYSEYRKYIVPGVKLPDYVKIALKYSPIAFNSFLLDFVNAYYPRVIDSTETHPFGDNLVITYSLTPRYSTPEYWDNPQRDYFTPDDIIKEVLDNFWYCDDSKKWIMEKINATIYGVRHALKLDGPVNKQDLEEEVLRTISAGTDMDEENLLRDWNRDSSWTPLRGLSSEFVEALYELDLSDLWYKYARLHKLYKETTPGRK